MRGVVLLLVVVIIQLTTGMEHEDDEECKYKYQDRLEKAVKQFTKKCLKKGYQSSLTGCESSPFEMVGWKAEKCKMMEQKLDVCGFKCKEPVKETFEHTGTCGTQHGKDEDDPNYWASNSNIPHLPSLSGFMGTHGTYRFMNVHEQIATLVGEGKHGMWRLQSAGYVRVYRAKGSGGVMEKDKDDALDGADDSLNKIIKEYYFPIDGNNRYHEHSFGEEVSEEGWMNWLDLDIYHPKFDGKYDDHEIIDLPWYYCGLSGADFPHIGNVWKYIKEQKRANKVGPLGKRAGMDVRENFNNILQMEFFGDGAIYLNVGQDKAATDTMVKNLNEAKNRAQTLHFAKVDTSKIASEIYILERGYHNYPESYLIVGVVMDSLEDPKDYAYVRPDGRYYDNAIAKGLTVINDSPNFEPPAYVENMTGPQKIYGTPGFGVNHPFRAAHGLTGGLCPNKGGDVSTYPWKNAGSAWPTDYEEITPICDGLVIDIKYWAYLDKEWAETTWLGNSGYGTQTVEYSSHANDYGEFTDPYLVKNNIKNPQELKFTTDGNVVDKLMDDHPMVNFTLDFGVVGELIEYNEVELDELPRGCAADKD